MLLGVDGSLGAVGDACLVEGVAHVPADGVEAYHKLIGNLLVALAGCEQAKHLNLASREMRDGRAQDQGLVIRQVPEKRIYGGQARLGVSKKGRPRGRYKPCRLD